MKQKLLLKPEHTLKVNYHSYRQQSFRILSLNCTDLLLFLRQQADQNPFVSFSATQEFDLSMTQDTTKESLNSVIENQARYLTPAPDEQIISFLISRLNSNGTFSCTYEELLAQSPFPQSLLDAALHQLRRLEPIGCFCFSLKQSLQVQCEVSELAASETGLILCDYLEEIALHRLDKIQEKTELSLDEIEEGIAFIQTLNPKPAANYATQSITLYPEARIEVQEGQINIEMLSQGFKLELDDFTQVKQEILRQQRLAAKNLVRCVRQREVTLLQILQTLCTIQEDFFLHQAPLVHCTLEDVAAKCHLHPSTVSRAIANKSFEFNSVYRPIKSLFSRGGTAHHNDSTIKEKLCRLIEHENKAAPYSDEKLRKLLALQGIFISRRTVTKYREACYYFNASKRKQYPPLKKEEHK